MDEHRCETLPLSRRFVTAGLVALGASGCATHKFATRDVARDGETLTLAFAEFPDLARPGGRVAVRPDGKGKPVLVQRIDEAEARALSLRCMHMGCTVGIEEGGGLRCPCHGSRYNDDGSVAKGPTKKPLERYSAAVGGDAIVVRLVP